MAATFYVEEEWDEYGHDVTGEDDWVEPLDDLFAEALALARAGNWATATEALHRLLMAFELEEEEGVFGGEEAPSSLVQTEPATPSRPWRCWRRDGGNALGPWNCSSGWTNPG